jgi:hypothetical protein
MKPVTDEHAALTLAKFHQLIAPIRETARRLGYAVGVHGSLRRDIDLIAVPWTAEAVSADELVAAIVATIECVNGLAFVINDATACPNDFTRRSPQPKPHGRLGWSVHLGGGPYVDLSVCQPPTSPAHRAELEAARREGYADGLSDGVVYRDGLEEGPPAA